MVRRTVWCLTSMLLAIGSLAAAAPRASRPVAAAGGQYDSRRNITYALARTDDGGIRMTADMPDLQFDKTSYRDGHFVLRMTSSGDTVTFAVSRAGTEIRRGAASKVLVAGITSDQDLDEVRSLLAGSRAVKRYRALAAALEQSDENTPAGHGVLIAAAVVHTLDGDPAAGARLAKRLARKLKPTAALQPVGMYEDCWESYSKYVTQAADDFLLCMSPASWWNFNFFETMCTFEWTIRVEGYWFEYLGCSMVPVK